MRTYTYMYMRMYTCVYKKKCSYDKCIHRQIHRHTKAYTHKYIRNTLFTSYSGLYCESQLLVCLAVSADLTDTYKHNCIHTSACIHKCTQAQMHTDTQIHVRKHKCIQTQMHAHTHTHKFIRTNTYHTCTNFYTYYLSMVITAK